MYKPPPPREIWQKGPLTKNKPRGILLELYGISVSELSDANKQTNAKLAVINYRKY